MMMKKLFTSIIALLLLFTTGCSAQSIDETEIILTINNPVMSVNGIERSIDNEGTVPIIINERTLLPVRAVVEAMGGTVKWNGDTQTVTLNRNSDTINLIIGSQTAYLNDKAEVIDTAPTILNNRTMLPIRFIAENFGFTVNWDNEYQTVTIREQKADNSQSAVSTPNPSKEPQLPETIIPEENTMTVTINGTAFTAVLSDNSSAEAFRNLLKEKDITIEMHDYANFEKVGSLGTSLPRNDEQITTEPGDIILYQGNQITIYYDTNSWNFTRLGKIENITQSELMRAMGTGNATVTFSLYN